MPQLSTRCDLLSFHYLCAIRNSYLHSCFSGARVVICFHFIIFVLLETADRKRNTIKGRCDLLSFHYLCAIRNSFWSTSSCIGTVVICFHFIIFVLLETAVELVVEAFRRCDLLSFHYLCAIRNSISFPNLL